LEDFVLGPCLSNIALILNHGKFVSFINKFLQMDFSVLSQRDRLIKIFVFTMRLLSMLLLNSEE